MARNRGKPFETVIRECVEKLPDVIIERLKDTRAKQKKNRNPSDFIAYKKPYLYYLECKTTHGSTLPFSNIRQWDELVKRSQVDGVWAGVICWFVEYDRTMWIDIQLLQELKKLGYKSIAYHASFAIEPIKGIEDHWGWVPGHKKRVYYEYEMWQFFNDVEGRRELET